MQLYEMNYPIDLYFDNANQWKEELLLLRMIVLDCQLTETLKWGTPCYTDRDRNIVLIHVFKEYCALLFFKGALLPDPNNILIQQTEHVQAGRQIRFTNAQEIAALEPVLKSYVQKAIETERSGLKIVFKKTREFNMPEEFQSILKEDPALESAFEALTPGRQRAYLLYFSQPKQSKTRISRIEKSIPAIFKGKGLND